MSIVTGNTASVKKRDRGRRERRNAIDTAYYLGYNRRTFETEKAPPTDFDIVRSNMSSRRERARIQEQRKQRAQRSRYMYMAAGVVAIVILVALALMGSGILNPAVPPPPVAASDGSATCTALQTFPTLSRDHIQPNQPHPPYSSNPPTSGWHWANPQDWGIYTTPQVQEQLVHNLEHGGIIVQYNGLSDADVQRLTNLVSRDNYHMILAPYPGLTDAKVALTAWDHLQKCTGVDENAINAFINSYRDKGPELVP